MKQMCKVCFFQKDVYISFDFLEKEVQVVCFYDIDVDFVQLLQDNFMELEMQSGKCYIYFFMLEIVLVNVIKMELEFLAYSIERDE